MAEYLDRYQYRIALVDISADDDLSEAVDLVGFELMGIVIPAAIDGDGTLDISIQIDPGAKVSAFYALMDDAGAAVSTFANVSASELLQVDAGQPPICGAKLKLSLSAAQTADREFGVMLKTLE